jgi:hypothetical protein
MRFGSPGFVYNGPAESVVGRTFARLTRSNASTAAAGHAVFVRGFLNETIMAMLGPNLTQEHFRLAAYYLTDLASHASAAELLAWGEFRGWYTVMYPRGQQDLPDDLVTTYVDALRAPYTATGSATARRAPPSPARDFTCECFVCVAPSSSSSTNTEPAPRHRAMDAQRRARLDELAEARRQLDEELDK